MSRRIMRLLVFSTVIFCLVAASAVWGEEFYKDKTLKIIVPFPPGGGWDTYARVTARNIVNHIPGHPSVIVQNVPGAGGLVGVNFVYNRVKPDGLTIGMFQTTNAFLQLLGDPAVKFDVRKLSWLGAFTTRVSTCVALTDSPFKTIQDVIGSKEPLYTGAIAPGGGTTMEPLLLNRILGTNFKLVLGYRGTAAIRLALSRGEVQGLCGWGWSSVKATGKDLLAAGKIRVLVQISDRRAPDMPKDVPLITEITPEKMKPLLNVYLVPRVVGWNMMLPPGVPEDRVKILQEAFDETMKDPKFLAEAKQAKLVIAPVEGKAIARMIDRLFEQATPDVVEELKKITY
jgi:tripartite-type tricarboxylate transporter receptor subunit TctC